MCCLSGELTPLVACLGHETQTGVDVKVVVRTFLSPMLRTKIKDNMDGDVAMECIETSITIDETSEKLFFN